MFRFFPTGPLARFRTEDPEPEVPGFRRALEGQLRPDPPTIGLSRWRPAANPTLDFDPDPLGQSSSTPDFQPVAHGDRMCEACKGGRSSGMTGAYVVHGRTLCYKCAVKRLGFENEPSSDMLRVLAPFELRAK